MSALRISFKFCVGIFKISIILIIISLTKGAATVAPVNLYFILSVFLGLIIEAKTTYFGCEIGNTAINEVIFFPSSYFPNLFRMLAVPVFPPIS